ncbi:type IV secretory system conjugative DNA transfer family protein [Aureimonas psammosilenae]|uniref:type IV secretory system conjugative DNA transfer family protein n=1 Tax=Aureimonas psammosilenae TaxID=2495496 RepID=UPI0012610156|nr:hypothetical protein [Aureimonas psammosilenae]
MMLLPFMRRLVDRRTAAFMRDLTEGDDFKSTLAKGDREAAARQQWPEDRYPTLYRDTPVDVRRGVVWDGRLLGGRDVGHLTWNHLSPEIVEKACRESGHMAATIAGTATLILTILWLQVLPFGMGPLSEIFGSETPLAVKIGALASFLVGGVVTGYGLFMAYRFIGGRHPYALQRCIAAAFLLSYLTAWLGPMLAMGSLGSFLPSLLGMGSMPMSGGGGGGDGLRIFYGLRYPAWAGEIGAWMPFVWFYLAAAIQLVAAIPGMIGLFLAVAVVFVTAFYAAWSIGFQTTLSRWAAETGKPLTIATRDALLLWKAKAGVRETEYRAHARQVEDACGRLSSLPLIPVGVATGTTRARGDMKAPLNGQMVAFDGESIRVHTLVLGDTGAGKTRDVLKPLFGRIMGAAWGETHRLGAYVTDGKGSLYKDLLPMVAHRDDVRVIGTEDDMYGVDLLAGMSPLEVSSTFRSIASQNAGSGEEFWLEMASLLILHVATVAEALEFDPETMKERSSRLYSLASLLVIATDATVQKELAERVVALNGDLARLKTENRHLFDHVALAYESALWLRQSFAAMADDTRSSIVANVSAVLGKLVGAGTLTERFARGTITGNEIDVDFALNGGIVLVAIGESEFGQAGRIVATWLKQRLFVLAKRRLIKAPELCRNTTVALVADEYQMLATAGQNSDLDFWNVARETGVFFLGATQSVAALNQNIGKEATANLLNLFRNKIVMSTGEVETIDFVRKLAGDLPQGWEPDSTFYATQAEREQAMPVRPADVQAAFPVPTGFSLSDPAMEAAIGLDTRFIARSSNSPESRLATMQQANWRYEDKNKEVLTSGLSWQPKIRHDELRHGQGFAFAMIYRAGLDRADIIDMRSL